MCLIDCNGAISDFDAYGQGVVFIWLYAKQRGDGAKNTAIMSQLERKLNEVIKNASNSTYQINRRNTYSDYDTDRKWHCNIVELNIIIV
jgi:predicted secreted protein